MSLDEAYNAIAIHEGEGKHMWDIPPTSLTPDFFRVSQLVSESVALLLTRDCSQKTLFLELFYLPTICFVKISLFLLYFRLFSPNRLTKYLIYAGIAITGLYYLSRMTVGAVLCSPSPGSGEHWQIAITSDKCINFYSRSYDIPAMNILTDLYLIGIPVRTVWGLHLPVRKKIGVVAVFATGLL